MWGAPFSPDFHQPGLVGRAPRAVSSPELPSFWPCLPKLQVESVHSLPSKLSPNTHRGVTWAPEGPDRHEATPAQVALGSPHFGIGRGTP